MLQNRLLKSTIEEENDMLLLLTHQKAQKLVSRSMHQRRSGSRAIIFQEKFKSLRVALDVCFFTTSRAARAPPTDKQITPVPPHPADSILC